jgi:hypothetical protein
MHHPRRFKPESIANVQPEIQIVDTHEAFETLIVIGLQAFGLQINRTLLIKTYTELATAANEAPGKRP